MQMIEKSLTDTQVSTMDESYVLYVRWRSIASNGTAKQRDEAVVLLRRRPREVRTHEM